MDNLVNLICRYLLGFLAELDGFSDYALELLNLYRQEGIISDSLYNDISKILLPEEEIGKGRFSPEIKLYWSLRRGGGEFIRDRFPALYRQLERCIGGGRR